jgi:hypothetical protein
MGLTLLDTQMIEVPTVLENLFTPSASATNLSAVNLKVNDITEANILFTQNQINADTLNSNKGVFSSLSADNLVPGVVDFFVDTLNQNTILSVSDNSKAYHCDTSISFTVSFPEELPVGFNVSLVNIGTGTLFLSTDSVLNAAGTFNETQYTGVLIYKADNNQFYGIGVFE